MATENIIFKVLFDTTDATKQVNSLDTVFEKADDTAKEFNDTLKKGADGLKEVAKAKKAYIDATALSIIETKALSAEIQAALMKDKEFMKASKEVADSYKKGKIDQVQATKLLDEAINKGVEATQKMAVETEKVVVKMKSYKAQISELKAVLPTLTGNEYIQAQAKLADLTDAMGDQQAQIKLLASDTRALDTTMQGLQLGVGVFAGLQGASALFGEQSADVEKALLKVNGAMAVLQSLQAIQNTLDEKSGFVNSVKLYWKSLFVKETIAETVAIEGNVAATEASIIVGEENAVVTAVQTTETGLYGIALRVVTAIQTQFGISAAAAWAIATGGVAILVAAIATIAYAVYQANESMALFIANQQNLRDISNEAQKSVADEKTSLETLILVAKDETQSKKDRLEAIKKINEISPEYLGNLTLENINTATGIDLVNKYIKSLDAKATAEAIYAKKVELKKQIIDLDTKAVENNAKWYDKLAASVISHGNASLYAGYITALGSLNTSKDIEVIQKQIDALDDLTLSKLKNGEISVADLVSTKAEVKEVKVKPKQIKFEPVENVTVLGIDEVVDKLKKPLEISKPLIIDVDIIDTKQLDDTLKKINEFRSNLKQSLGTIGGDSEQIFGDIGNEIANAFDFKAINKGVSDAKQQLESDKAKARENEKNASKMSDSERVKQRDKDNEAIANSQKKLDDLQATQKQKLAALVTGALSIVSSGLSLADKAVDRNIAKIDKAIDYQKTSIERARDLADKGNSQLLYAEEKKMIKLEELRRREAKKKKAIAIADAVVNTAIAVTSALATDPFIPLGPIAAALAGAMGAVQIGIIASQPFAKGGFTGDGTGRRDNTGHIPVGIVHDNEFVMDKEYTSKNRNELEYIHKNRIPLADIIKNNQMPVMSFNNILGGLQVNSSGQLEERMRAVESAILDLPNRMPQTSMNVDSRGLSIRVTELASKEKNWKR
jgi:hypothetical protein